MKVTTIALSFFALTALSTPIFAQQQAIPASFEATDNGRQEIRPGWVRRGAKYLWCRWGPEGGERWQCLGKD